MIEQGNHRAKNNLGALSWETVSCDFCGEVQSEFVMKGRDLLLHLPGKFQFVRCTECGLIRQNPRLTSQALQRYYPSDYQSFAKPITMEQCWWRRWDRRFGLWKRRRIVSHVSGLAQNVRLLDVGCATGNFLHEMSRQEGWQVCGVEPNAYAAQLAREALGLDVQTTTLRNAGLEPESFEVVTLWNVLEHVPSPMTTLRLAHKILRKDGILIISVPVVDSTLASLFGLYWAEWDLPRHLHIFSHNTIRSFMRTIGFEKIEVKASISEYRVFSMSLKNLFRERLSNEQLASVIVQFPLIRMVGSLMLRIAIPPHRNSVPVFLFQKLERIIESL